MKILAVESTSMAAGAALIQEDRLIGEIRTNHKKNHSEQLLPMVDQLLQLCDISLSAIDAFAVSLGPGSFTGIRIGVATVKGLAQALNKPVIGVNTLEALAWQAAAFNGWVIPIMDAQRNLVYTASYSFEVDQAATIIEPDVLHIQELMAVLNETKGALYLLGDALPLHRERLKKGLGDRVHFALPIHAMPSASALAQCALKKALAGEGVPAAQIQPVYLRTSQAEKVYQQQQLLQKTRNTP
ncbi:MAG: tRNA (adenosine(37)-N6)-threonylcarbamoyltransferase complex dimerization subunit type 1 TsaB [Bacillota bacterium]|nr:tRNA (adenosine(37)-N6)-threonylcarbamoyltransferase complex dimerization subunit type 1 TsaB [Bacillota bacterium]MDW7676662.1 tRNA (adenosine(37)-N6)-threonylcarbamoyltransferase complex dimerization subunit type 1 TsaB [Bacillota bacterium]